MPFIKDDKRINRNGRPKQKTKTNAELKELLSQMINRYLDELNNQNDKLTLRDKITFSRYVLPYILPKLNSVQITEDKEPFEPVTIDIKDLFRIKDANED